MHVPNLWIYRSISRVSVRRSLIKWFIYLIPFVKCQPQRGWTLNPSSNDLPTMTTVSRVALRKNLSFRSDCFGWLGHAHHCLSNFHLKPLNQSDTVNPHSFLSPWFWQIDSTIDPSLRILATHQPQILIVWKIDEKKIVIFGYTIF